MGLGAVAFPRGPVAARLALRWRDRAGEEQPHRPHVARHEQSFAETKKQRESIVVGVTKKRSESMTFPFLLAYGFGVHFSPHGVLRLNFVV